MEEEMAHEYSERGQQSRKREALPIRERAARGRERRERTTGRTRRKTAGCTRTDDKQRHGSVIIHCFFLPDCCTLPSASLSAFSSPAVALGSTSISDEDEAEEEEDDEDDDDDEEEDEAEAGRVAGAAGRGGTDVTSTPLPTPPPLLEGARGGGWGGTLAALPGAGANLKTGAGWGGMRDSSASGIVLRTRAQ